MIGVREEWLVVWLGILIVREGVVDFCVEIVRVWVIEIWCDNLVNVIDKFLCIVE